MGWLTQTTRQVVPQALRQTQPNTEFSGERIIWMPSKHLGGIRMTPDEALRLSAVWACVTVIAKALASCDWEVFRELDNGDRQPRRRLAAYELLNTRPNPESTAFSFKEAMYLQAATWGNFYAEIEKDLGGRPVNLWPLAPERCSLEREDDERLVLVVRNRGKTEAVLDYDDVFHLHGPGVDGLSGFDVVTTAARSLAHVAAAERFGQSFYHNGTQLGGLLHTDQKLPEEKRKAFTEEIEKRRKGSDNAFGLLTLDSGFTYTSMGVDPDKGQFIETRHLLIEEVCRWFGVPPHKIAHLLRSTFCLPADVQVSTEFGPKSVADIEVGERVWSLGQDGSFDLKPVVRSGSTGRSKILTIKTRGRTLRANAQHRVLVRREVLEPYEGGRGRYSTVDGRRYRKSWQNLYTPAGEIRVGDYLLAVDEFPAQAGRSAPTREATVEFMELLGHLIGDGFYFKNGRSKVTSGFGISHAANDDCVPHYITAAEEVFAEVERYAYGRPADSGTALIAKARDPNTTIFHSVAACAELRECGVVGTAKTKRVPSWVFGLAPDLKLAFLRGYLDADGTVNPIGQIRFVSCNEALLQDIQQLCMSVGVRCGEVYSTERRSSFDGYDETLTAIYGVVCSNVAANARIGSNDPMRAERLAAALESRRKRTVTVYPNESKRRSAGDGLRASKVVSITVGDEEEVFDLSVADNHSFVANGVVVHNSNIEHQSIEFVRDALTPWAERAAQEADWKLLRPWPGIRTRVDLEWLAEGDAKSKAETDAILVANGIINRNEARKRRGMNGAGGDLDKFTVQVNMTTLEKVGADMPVPENDDEAAAVALFHMAALKSLRRRARVAEQLAEQTDDAESFRAGLAKDINEHARYAGAQFRQALDVLKLDVDPEAIKATLVRWLDEETELLVAAFGTGDAAFDQETRAKAVAVELSRLIER